MFALRWNWAAALAKRFRQCFKGPDDCHGGCAASTRFEAFLKAQQQVPAFFKDRLVPWMHNWSPALQHSDPLVEGPGWIQIEVLPLGQFLEAAMSELDSQGLADDHEATVRHKPVYRRTCEA